MRYISYSKWSETSRCFITIAFQIYLLVFADGINLLENNINTTNKQKRRISDSRQ